MMRMSSSVAIALLACEADEVAGLADDGSVLRTVAP